MGMETDGELDNSLQGFYVDVFQLRTESSYVSSINMVFFNVYFFVYLLFTSFYCFFIENINISVHSANVHYRA